jgi:hypothetical protein
MHEAVTTSTTTKSYFTSAPDDLLTPVALANRSKSTEALGWSPVQDTTIGTDHILEVPSFFVTLRIKSPIFYFMS